MRGKKVKELRRRFRNILRSRPIPNRYEQNKRTGQILNPCLVVWRTLKKENSWCITVLDVQKDLRLGKNIKNTEKKGAMVKIQMKAKDCEVRVETDKEGIPVVFLFHLASSNLAGLVQYCNDNIKKEDK